MTRPRFHFKIAPGEVDADNQEDNPGQLAHEERVELAKLFVDFLRLAMDRRTPIARLADTSFIRRMRQANIQAEALAQRVAESEKSGCACANCADHG